jgi:hypothetical protein
VVHFKRDHVGPPPTTLRELFQKAFSEIAASAPIYSSSGIPGSSFWTVAPFTPEELEITVSKIGKGLTVSFMRKGMPGLPISQCPAACTLELLGKWFISFGAEEQVSDFALMQYLINITSAWDGKAYGQPWRILLSAQPWRHPDTGEILLSASFEYPQDTDPHLKNPRIPMNAAQPRTSITATRPKEIGRLLKFGRDSDWPLYISLASTLDGTNFATTMWFLSQFATLSAADGLIGLPVGSRQNIPWIVSLRKESNSIRVTLHEKTPAGEFVSTPEEDGIPCFLLYGPRATIKMRCEYVDVANRYLTMMYGEMPEVSEMLHTQEWSLIAALNGGEIPAKHRVIRNPDVSVANSSVWNKEIFDAGLRTQTYDKGMDRFVRKFDPSQPVSAVIAIEPGCHFDHGTAIYFQQDKRRCLLLDTLYGLSDDEAFWYTPQSWAKLQPRLVLPRSEPGKLYFPAPYIHVIQKYWNYLDNPLRHPDCCESDFTKAAMSEFASALSQMDLSHFIPEAYAEASDKSCRTAHDAATSRKCPIQDTTDY